MGGGEGVEGEGGEEGEGEGEEDEGDHRTSGGVQILALILKKVSLTRSLGVTLLSRLLGDGL